MGHYHHSSTYIWYGVNYAKRKICNSQSTTSIKLNIHKLFICEIWGSHGICYDDSTTVTLLSLIQMCENFRWTCSSFLWNAGSTYLQHYKTSHPRKLLSLQLCLAIIHVKRNLLLCVHTSAWLEMKPGQTITHLKGEMKYIFPFSLIFQIIIFQSYVKICIYVSNELLENHISKVTTANHNWVSSCSSWSSSNSTGILYLKTSQDHLLPDTHYPKQTSCFNMVSNKPLGLKVISYGQTSRIRE